MRLLFIGDIVGGPGRHIVQEELPRLIDEYKIDFTVANGENSAGGFGMNKRSFNELYACGIDAFTLGNHTWDNKEIFSFIENTPQIVRPANYPQGSPGKGVAFFEVLGRRLRVINLIGRVFLPATDCPFRTLDKILKEDEADWTFVDFHAEATSEKIALGWYADGRVSALVGTHTHVQTADSRILPKGTAYMTDVGMTGPRDSVLGTDKDIIVNRFIKGYSPRFDVANGDLQFNAVLFDFADDGSCKEIQPINFWKPSL